MPIFTKKSLSVLYLHPPKTAGSYVSELFLVNGFQRDFFVKQQSIVRRLKCSPQHYHAEILAGLLDFSAFDVCFMTVRHPFSRLVSEYCEQQRSGVADKGLDFACWAEKVILEASDNPFVYDNHIRPQSDFFVPAVPVFRQETGLEATGIRRLVEGHEDAPSTWLDVDRIRVSEAVDFNFSQATANLIFDYYRQDFDLFGYSETSTKYFDKSIAPLVPENSVIY